MRTIRRLLTALPLLLQVTAGHAAPYTQIVQGDLGGLPQNRVTAVDVSLWASFLSFTSTGVMPPGYNLGGLPLGGITTVDVYIITGQYYFYPLTPLQFPLKLKSQANCDALLMGPDTCDNAIDWINPVITPLGGGTYGLDADARSVNWSPLGSGLNVANNYRGQLAASMEYSTDGGSIFTATLPAGASLSGSVQLIDTGTVKGATASSPRSVAGFSIDFNCGTYVGPVIVRPYVPLVTQEELSLGGTTTGKDYVDFALTCP